MKQRVSALCVLLAWMGVAHAAEHAARGVLLKKDAARHIAVISCDGIPGYMAAMEMSFKVQDEDALTRLKAGDILRFTFEDNGEEPVAKNIHRVENFEAEPAEASGLSALRTKEARQRQVPVGALVPDFELTDQVDRRVRLSDFRGKVVALTFGYSRCPNPNYCLRLSRNLSRLIERFKDPAGRELVLVTIAIDPEYDHGETLRRYAQSFGADARQWHFLTGTVAQVKDVSALFGMDFWSDEGLLTHALHTVVIDRNGLLAANIEGNAFTPKQLGDLIETVMHSGSVPNAGARP
jgi:protein SCO1/2